MSRSKRRASHTVYDLRVHLVWITKYRYKVLDKEIGGRVRELVTEVTHFQYLNLRNKTTDYE